MRAAGQEVVSQEGARVPHPHLLAGPGAVEGLRKGEGKGIALLGFFFFHDLHWFCCVETDPLK